MSDNVNKEVLRIQMKYPDRIPVLVIRSSTSQKDIPLIDKTKYLVPMSLTVGDFIYVIRRRLKMGSDQALFLFTEKSIVPPLSMGMLDLYKNHASSDGMLRIFYSGESVFG